jgi:hypothetical protein
MILKIRKFGIFDIGLLFTPIMVDIWFRIKFREQFRLIISRIGGIIDISLFNKSII